MLAKMFPGVPKCLDTAPNYYKVIGVSKDASQDDLKKAYGEAAAIINHPDKGGDPERLKELDEAYKVLGHPEKREIYDRFRQDFFCTVTVSLSELYNGTKKKHRIPFTCICSKCNGKGCKSGVPVMLCSICGGVGLRIYGRHRDIRRLCGQCIGSGRTPSETLTEESRCEQCKGEKVVWTEKTILFTVKKGMPNGQKLTVRREVLPSARGGSIVFVLEQEEHPKFKRKGDDLFVEHTLSLMEALFGFQFTLTHLDKRQLIVKSQPGEVVQHGQFKAIDNEGMPVYQSPSMKGKLYIHFKVELPDPRILTPDQFKVLEALVGPRPSPQLTDMDVGEETTLHDVNQQQAQEAYDDMRHEMKIDEDMHGGVQRSAAASVDGNNGGGLNGGGGGDVGEETTLHDVNQQQVQEAYDDMHREMMKMNIDEDMSGGGAQRSAAISVDECEETTLHDVNQQQVQEAYDDMHREDADEDMPGGA